MSGSDESAQPVDIVRIYDLLYRLGISARLTGFLYVTYAVWLSLQERERLDAAANLLYPDIAKRYRTTLRYAEQNIRTVCDAAWKRNRPLLEELAHRPLTQRPTASEFIAILTEHFALSHE